MALDLTKLEKVRQRGLNRIARCPACAEKEGDQKGEHLFISDKGQFGCVLNPGVDGQQHRQRIFELAGIKEMPQKNFEVRKPAFSGPKVIKRDILGRLGRLFSTHAHKREETDSNNSNTLKDFKNAVPSVPTVTPLNKPPPSNPQGCFIQDPIFEPSERQLLKDCPPKYLEGLTLLKKVFIGCRVVAAYGSKNCS